MGFYIDFSAISLEEFKSILKDSNLVPSRMLLKEYADFYFKLLGEVNIDTVDELLIVLKNKAKISEFSKKTGVSIEYLTILAREIKSFRRKPSKIKEFPGIEVSIVQNLAKVGIENAYQLFSEVLTSENRETLSKKTDIDLNEILKITKLADLSRIRWVNHTFANVLLNAGFDTVEKVANANPKVLCAAVRKVNNKNRFFPGNIGLTDIERCIESAKIVSLDIKY